MRVSPGEQSAAQAREQEVLAALAALGGYFDLRLLTADAAPAGLRSFAELYDCPDVVAARMAWVADRFGPVEPRVAASVTHLGFAARLVSPALAAACAGVVVDIPPTSLLWEPNTEQVTSWLSGPYRFAAAPAAAAEVAQALAGTLLERHLVPLGAAVRDRTRISPRLLWGNVAAAVGGAVMMISLHRSEWADRAAAVAAALLERPPLAGLGRLVQPDAGRPHRFFVRRSCCLYYRAPGGSKCGDCALLDEDTRARQWQEILSAGEGSAQA